MPPAIKEAHCSKCGFKHPRPVGSKCKNLNMTAPNPDTSASKEHSTAENDSQSADSQAVEPPVTGLENKIDILLKRMDNLQNKNSLLEKHILSKPSGVSSSSIVHSSPKGNHQCTSACSHAGHNPRRVHTSRMSSSDADFAAPLQASVSHISQADLSADSHHPSVQHLRPDERIQRQVQKQLEKLQGQPRHAAGTKIKSGLLRAGDNAVKQEISWPHHHCFPGPGGQLPEYKELSPLQFMVGFIGCVQDESSHTVKANMLEYAKHLFQDAIETNWSTAKHAHMLLLQDIERGRCTWRQPDVLEKIRIRNTTRVIAPKQPTTQTNKPKTNPFAKVCKDFNNNTCKQPGGGRNHT